MPKFGSLPASVATLRGRPHHLCGLYKALVEYTEDPKGLGRVKVRIFALHGDPRLGSTSWKHSDKPIQQESISLEDLPWAWPCMVPGTFITPEAGDTVWIMFEQGDPQCPVYMGTWYGTPEHGRERGRAPHLPDPKKWDPGIPGVET